MDRISEVVLPGEAGDVNKTPGQDLPKEAEYTRKETLSKEEEASSVPREILLQEETCEDEFVDRPEVDQLAAGQHVQSAEGRPLSSGSGGEHSAHELHLEPTPAGADPLLSAEGTSTAQGTAPQTSSSGEYKQTAPTETLGVSLSPLEAAARGAAEFDVAVADAELFCPQRKASFVLMQLMDDAMREFEPHHGRSLSFNVLTEIHRKGSDEVLGSYTVRRTVEEFYRLQEVLSARRPHLMLLAPPKDDTDPLTGEKVDVFSTPIVEARRQKLETLIQRIVTHPDLRGTVEVLEFLTNQRRHLSKDDVSPSPVDMHLLKLKVENSLGMLPKLPERAVEEPVWRATERYYDGLHDIMKTMSTATREVVHARLELQHALHRMIDATNRLAAFELQSAASPETALLEKLAEGMKYEAHFQYEQAVHGDAPLADVLGNYERCNGLFKTVNERRNDLLLRVEQLEGPINEDKNALNRLILGEPESATQRLGDRVLAKFLRRSSTEKDTRETRQEQLRREILDLEAKEELSMEEYDHFCERVREELERLQEAKSNDLSAALNRLIDLKHACSRKGLALWGKHAGQPTSLL